MNPNEYIQKMANIQKNLLEYIDGDSTDVENKSLNFKDLLVKNKIQDDKHEFKSFLHLLVKISNNHHQTGNFFNKIEEILNEIKDDLQQNFTNSEIFRIFKSNKRILLFLIEEKILNFDEFVAKQIASVKYNKYKYLDYFQPEIQPFFDKYWFPYYLIPVEQKEVPEDFYEKRKIGQNDCRICTLIRKDLLDDFIKYVNENNYPLNSLINQSIYETNKFLLKKEKTTLIEYAAFFGSIRIFNYLRLNKISLTPSLWNYAIYANNAEIIQILEDNNIELEVNKPFKHLFKEAIKCHHNDIAYYFQNNNLDDSKINSFCEMIHGIKYYNFAFIQNDKINEQSFSYLCKYDYYILVTFLLNTGKIDINKRIIQNHIFE